MRFKSYLPVVLVLLVACAAYEFAPNNSPPGCGGGGEWRLTTKVGLRTKVILDDLRWDTWVSGVDAGTAEFRIQRPTRVGIRLLVVTDRPINDWARNVSGAYVIPMIERRLCVYESRDGSLVFKKVGR